MLLVKNGAQAADVGVGAGMDDRELGRRIGYWRRRRKLTQAVFADRLGRSKSWVEKVERGERSAGRLSVLDDICQVLHVDVAQACKRLRLAFVQRVEGAEVGAEALVGCDREVHLPDPLVVAEERERGRGPADRGHERRAGEREAAALGAAGRPDPARVDFRHGHHHPGELGRVQEDLPEENGDDLVPLCG